jgi:hypothetical protein
LKMEECIRHIHTQWNSSPLSNPHSILFKYFAVHNIGLFSPEPPFHPIALQQRIRTIFKRSEKIFFI